MNQLRELAPWLYPWALWLYRAAEINGLKPHVTSVYRSPTEQALLYDRYLRGGSKYPVAPPGRSMHQYRLAFDMTSQDNAWLGSIWKSVGGQWSPSDSVHFGV